MFGSQLSPYCFQEGAGLHALTIPSTLQQQEMTSPGSVCISLPMTA